MRAFADLSTCRQSGMTPGPIPWTAIVQYADRAGLPPDMVAGFVLCIREMDGAWLEYQAERARAEADKPRTRRDQPGLRRRERRVLGGGAPVRVEYSPDPETDDA